MAALWRISFQIFVFNYEAAGDIMLRVGCKSHLAALEVLIYKEIVIMLQFVNKILRCQITD